MKDDKEQIDYGRLASEISLMRRDFNRFRRQLTEVRSRYEWIHPSDYHILALMLPHKPKNIAIRMPYRLIRDVEKYAEKIEIGPSTWHDVDFPTCARYLIAYGIVHDLLPDLNPTEFEDLYRRAFGKDKSMVKPITISNSLNNNLEELTEQLSGNPKLRANAGPSTIARLLIQASLENIGYTDQPRGAIIF